MGSKDFAVFVPVGPGQRELDRIGDLLESLFYHEPSVSHVVFIDDVPPGKERSLETFFKTPPGCRVVSLRNPRNGRGNGIQGCITAGTIAAFHWIVTNTNCRFTLKLDSDSLIVAPFSAKIIAAFEANPDVSLYGCYSKTPNRDYNLPEDVSMAPALKKLQRWLTIWRRTCASPWPRLQWALFRDDNIRRRLIQSAVKNGYLLGRHCQGGGFAIRQEMLQTMLESGFLEEPLLWMWTPCSEDVVLTLAAFAHDSRADDLTGDNQPFAVIYQGLVDTPPRLIERGFSIIHSLKDFGPYREADTREFFKQLRI